MTPTLVWNSYCLYLYRIQNHNSQLPCRPPDSEDLRYGFLTYPTQVMGTSSDSLCLTFPNPLVFTHDHIGTLAWGIRLSVLPRIQIGRGEQVVGHQCPLFSQSFTFGFPPQSVFPTFFQVIEPLGPSEQPHKNFHPSFCLLILASIN